MFHQLDHLKIFFITITLVFFLPNLLSQNIAGYVTDFDTGEPLIGAKVKYGENAREVFSNNYGFFRITNIKDTTCKLSVFVAEYKNIDTLVYVEVETLILLRLKNTHLLEEVHIDGQSLNKESFTSAEIKKIPTFLGETDIIKAFQLLPGVKQGAEGFSSMLIRGGTSDQVQYLLDDMPLYNVNHMGGYISTFNTDAISHAELFKNHTPVNYSGKLSGILDIRTKEGSLQKWNGSVSSGLLSTKFCIGGPLIKNKSSLQISLRRLNLDLITTPFLKLIDAKTQPRYSFYDGLLKYTHKINENNKVSFSFFNSIDNLRLISRSEEVFSESKLDYIFNWGTTAASIRLLQNPSPRFFIVHVLSGNIYRYNINVTNSDFESGNEVFYHKSTLNMNTKNFSEKSTVEYSVNHKFKILSGLSYEYLISSPGNLGITQRFDSKNTFNNYKLRTYDSHQLSVFAGADIGIGERLVLNIGANNLLFKSSSLIKNYLQPRVQAKFALNEKSNLQLSYCENVQALHLLTNNGVGLPTDAWMPADSSAPPQQARQLNLGYHLALFKSKYTLQTNIYYKTSSNLVRYNSAFNLFNSKGDWHDNLEKNGKGLSYGTEILIKKETGVFSGFVAYTLSKTTNQFVNLNNGKPFYFNYDRRHEINVFVNYNVNERISCNAVFNFATGNPLTIPVAIYNFSYPNLNSLNSPVPNNPPDVNENNTNYAFYYDGINKQRSRNFHRLDLSIRFEKQKRRGLRTWIFGIYNVYNHQNPFAYHYRYNYPKTSFELKSISVFQITPFFSYEFKF